MRKEYLLTSIFDYLWMGLTLLSFDYLVNDNLTPLKASTMVFVFSTEFIREILQMYVFFTNIIIDQAKNYRPDYDLIFSITRLKISFGIASAISTYYGYFVWDKLNLLSLMKIYFEFIVMIISKDIQLGIFHHWMHHDSLIQCNLMNKIDDWIAKTHHFHHRTTLNLNSISAFYTTMEDAVMENLAAPFVILGLKYLMNLNPTIHIGAFMMYIVYDIHGHSANPFTVVFFNPILDYLMRANIAHHNHHNRPKMNHRVIPFRHVFDKQEIIKDIEIYSNMRNIDLTIDDFIL